MFYLQSHMLSLGSSFEDLLARKQKTSAVTECDGVQTENDDSAGLER